VAFDKQGNYLKTIPFERLISLALFRDGTMVVSQGGASAAKTEVFILG
jgi:hypothetical protein